MTDDDKAMAEVVRLGIPLDEHGQPIPNPDPQEYWGEVVVPLDRLGNLRKKFFRPRPNGLRLPWEKCRDLVQFVPGRWTIWSGPTFSGKTHLLRQLALHAARSGEKVFFASFEEEPDEIRDAFVVMAAHTTKPSGNFVEQFGEWANDKILIAETIDMLSADELIDMLKQAVYVEGCKQVFVDSLMRLKLRTDDYDGQRTFGNVISKFCKQYRCHLHMVCHPRKTQNSRAAVDLYDIRGAGDLVAQADNVVVMTRHYDAELPDPSNVIEVFKQRGMETNWVGKIGLHYSVSSKQFLGDYTDQPMQFMFWNQYPAIDRGPIEKA